MRTKAVFVLSAVAATALCVAIVAMQEPPKPGYFLEHKTVETHGIRLGYKTTYRMLKDGALIWEKDTRDKYLQHWITPEGRVWTLSDSYSGPGGGGHLVLWDKDGEYEAVFSVDYIVDNGMFPGPDPRTISEWSTARIEQPRGNDSVESLTIDRDGKPFRHLVVRSPEAGVFEFDGARSRTEIDTSFQGALFDGDRPLPKPVYLIGNGTWVWRSNDDYWVVGSRQFDPPTSRAQRIGITQRVPGIPDRVQSLPSGRHVWFVLDKGIVALFDNAYKNIGETDLVKLGGFKDIAEAKEMISVLSMKIKQGEAWRDADDVHHTGQAVYVEQFDVSTYDGRRLVWTVKSYEPDAYSITTKVLSGLATRYPKESSYSTYKLLSEGSAQSPSRRFTLRIRKFHNEQRDATSWAVTLISNERDKSGKSIPIEVWSRTEYTGVVHGVVSDSGRVAVFKCGTMKSYSSSDARYVPHNMVYLFDLDRDNLVAQRLQMWVNGKNIDYISPQEAIDDIDFSTAHFASTGQPTITSFDGLEFPLFPTEVLEYSRKSGPPVSITIAPTSKRQGVPKG